MNSVCPVEWANSVSTNCSRHRQRHIQNECVYYINTNSISNRTQTHHISYIWTYAFTSNVCLFECPFSHYAVINAMAIYQITQPTSHMYWHLMIFYLVDLHLLKQTHATKIGMVNQIGSDPTNTKQQQQQQYHHHHHQMNENASPRLSSQISSLVLSKHQLFMFHLQPLWIAFTVCVCVYACSNPIICACSGVNTIYQFRSLYLDT